MGLRHCRKESLNNPDALKPHTPPCEYQSSSGQGRHLPAYINKHQLLSIRFLEKGGRIETMKKKKLYILFCLHATTVAMATDIKRKACMNKCSPNNSRIHWTKKEKRRG